MTRFHAFNDVFLALALALSGAVLAPTLAQLGGASAGAVIVLQGLLILAGLYLLLRRRNQGWRDLPFPRPSGWDLLRALQAFGLMFALNVVFILLVIQIAPDLVEAHQLKLAEVGALVGGDSPFVMVIMLMIFVGFYEEVLARGFLLKRCQQLLGTNGERSCCLRYCLASDIHTRACWVSRKPRCWVWFSQAWCCAGRASGR